MSDKRGSAGTLRLRLPATSANLGAGFDAAAVALHFFLKMQEEPARELSIVRSGRDRERCSHVDNNLIIGIYRRLFRESRKPVVPLTIRMVNDIPLGMGCEIGRASCRE